MSFHQPKKSTGHSAYPDAWNERDALLVKELQQGSHIAFRRLYDSYQADIFAYSRSLVKSDANAEDIVQEVFLRLWQHSRGLDSSLSLRSYIFTIARNLSFKFLAKAANNVSLKEKIFYKSQRSTSCTSDSLDDKEYNALKEMAIGLLPPKRRRIFEMSRNENKTYEDISRELNISISTVKNQMSKALESMRKYLIPHTDITLSLLMFVSSLFSL